MGQSTLSKPWAVIRTSTLVADFSSKPGKPPHPLASDHLGLAQKVLERLKRSLRALACEHHVSSSEVRVDVVLDTCPFVSTLVGVLIIALREQEGWKNIRLGRPLPLKRSDDAPRYIVLDMQQATLACVKLAGSLSNGPVLAASLPYDLEHIPDLEATALRVDEQVGVEAGAAVS